MLAFRRERFGPSVEALRGFTPILLNEGQQELVILPLVAYESRCLLTSPINLFSQDRSGLQHYRAYYARC
jgi:hypothetical protein